MAWTATSHLRVRLSEHGRANHTAARKQSSKLVLKTLRTTIFPHITGDELDTPSTIQGHVACRRFVSSSRILCLLFKAGRSIFLCDICEYSPLPVCMEVSCRHPLECYHIPFQQAFAFIQKHTPLLYLYIADCPRSSKSSIFLRQDEFSFDIGHSGPRSCSQLHHPNGTLYSPDLLRHSSSTHI